MTDPLTWVRRGAFLALLAVGWLFILWQNRFHLSAPTVFVCIGYLAILATVYTLWRTGVVAVADEDEGSDSTWGGPLGARGELEREKKMLLKAIKEAEFDREMGKISKTDADEMIQIYRARAIEVIKELDKLEAGAAGTVREQIEREVKARLELEAKTKKSIAGDKADAKKGDAKKGDAKKGDAKKADAKKADAKKADTKKGEAKQGEAETTEGAPQDTAEADAAGDAGSGDGEPASDPPATEAEPLAAPDDASANRAKEAST